MSYTQVLQTSDTGPSKFSRGNGSVPLDGTLPLSNGVTDQASFNGVYSLNDSNRGFRVTVQTADQGLIDPNKQYRVTIEEVTA